MYFLYPLILFLIPVHAAFANNYMEIPKKDYIKTLVFMEIVVGLLFSACLYLIKNPSLAALIFSLNFAYLLNANIAYIAFFSEYKRSQIRYFTLFCIYSVCFLSLINFIIYFVLKNVGLNLFDAVMFWGSLIITGFIAADVLPKLPKSIKVVDIKKDKINENLPDIYHIMLDAHAGFSFEDECDDYFKNELEKRGFKNYINFKSNYKVTANSLPSIFNMDYVQNFIKPQKKDCYTNKIAFPFYANNKVFDVLNRYGYKFNIYTHSCFNFLVESNKNILDFGETFVIGGNSIVKVLYFNSIFFLLYKVFMYKNPVNEIFAAFLRGIKKKYDRPVYHYMHVLAPHPPYFTDEKGRVLGTWCYGNDKYYFGYLKYIDKLTLQLIDKINAERKPNSLIIVHSDHNIRRNDNDKFYNFNILMSLLLPDKSDYQDFDKITSLVNLFRVIFNKYLGKSYEILEDKYYYSHVKDFVIEDVTNKVKERSF